MLGRLVQSTILPWFYFVARWRPRSVYRVCSVTPTSYTSALQLVADSVFIDRKLRYKVSPKVNIALKLLRAQLANLLAKQYRGKVLTESLMLWYDIALMILGKVNPNQEERSIQVAG